MFITRSMHLHLRRRRRRWWRRRWRSYPQKSPSHRKIQLYLLHSAVIVDEYRWRAQLADTNSPSGYYCYNTGSPEKNTN
ncbi:hypothetical protein HanXRQr2_Chr12g0521341 [Helianthus annuus]|uniref:Uncharacterized protein n=1 Tax=Helianthus annuus TaxID=4232 RepID=A0A251SY85_HELAN|nr:hypothetical protein HanXRQr2_Chr12g0521341 [Helianthus annuus]